MTSTADEDLIYADDLEIGSARELGTYLVSREEVLEFGRRWDPLAIHVDEALAAKSTFGGVIASGIHTMAIYQHLMATNFISRLAIIAGKGILDMQLENPVRPGDLLTAHVNLLDLQFRGRRADLTTRGVMHNQDGLKVFDMTGISVVRRRLDAE
jgi:acyl dehydratase